MNQADIRLREAERQAFQEWKGCDLPMLNHHGEFHQEWLQHEFVLFKAMCVGKLWQLRQSLVKEK